MFATAIEDNYNRLFFGLQILTSLFCLGWCGVLGQQIFEMNRKTWVQEVRRWTATVSLLFLLSQPIINPRAVLRSLTWGRINLRLHTSVLLGKSDSPHKWNHHNGNSLFFPRLFNLFCITSHFLPQGKFIKDLEPLIFPVKGDRANKSQTSLPVGLHEAAPTENPIWGLSEHSICASCS